jgi:hypothetical protein
MRRAIILAVSLVIISTTAFAHGGHKHAFLGTVKAVSADQLTIETKDGTPASFTLTGKTEYVRDGKSARREDLTAGLRVSVHVADDGKTATSIKLAN